MVSTNQVEHPQDDTVGHDLDPNADGDLVRTITVANAQALLIALSSQDGEPISVSLEWVNNTDATATFVSESAADLDLSGVTDDWARAVRKGPACKVTATSDAAAGTTNRANMWLDTHR